MFKGWISQGIVTNLLSAAIIAGSGIIVTILAKNASAWALPTLCGLGASTCIAMIIVAIRNGLLRSIRVVAKPNNATKVVRAWLDNAKAPTQNSPIDGWSFNYVFTVDNIKIAIGQENSDRSYLQLSTSITFTEEHNRLLESSPGGIVGTLRSLRIALAASRTIYYGTEIPLKQITIRKRVFIGDGLLEHELNEAILGVEASFNLTVQITAPPMPQQS